MRDKEIGEIARRCLADSAVLVGCPMVIGLIKRLIEERNVWRKDIGETFRDFGITIEDWGKICSLIPD